MGEVDEPVSISGKYLQNLKGQVDTRFHLHLSDARYLVLDRVLDREDAWWYPGSLESVMAPAAVLSWCASRGGFRRPNPGHLSPARTQYSPTTVSGSLRPLRRRVRFTIRERRGGPHPMYEPRMPSRALPPLLLQGLLPLCFVQPKENTPQGQRRPGDVLSPSAVPGQARKLPTSSPPTTKRSDPRNRAPYHSRSANTLYHRQSKAPSTYAAPEWPRASRFLRRSAHSAGGMWCSRARSRKTRASSMCPSDAWSSAYVASAYG